MDDNDLYLHIRRKIVTFSQQAKNTTNHISTHECMQIKPQSFKQFQVKAPKGLKNGAVYEIDYNAKGIPENVIPVLDTFIAGKCQKFIGITVINQSDDIKWIPQGQHIGTVHLIEGRTPSKEEVLEIIHKLKSIHRKLMRSAAEAQMTSSPATTKSRQRDQYSIKKSRIYHLKQKRN